MVERLAQVDDMPMPEPRIKRYALVQDAGADGVRRFHLARVASASRSVRSADRLERMEAVAALDRARRPAPQPPGPPPGRCG